MYRCKSCDRLARLEYVAKNYEKSLMSQRSRNLKYRFGLTSDDYNRILKSQDGRCGICGKVESENKVYKARDGSKRFCVDHSHETNLVRGLLCNNCNRGLGLLGDNLSSMLKVIKYFKGN